MGSSKKRRLVNIGIIFSVFALLAIMFSFETYFYYKVQGKETDFWNTLSWNIARWLPWAFFAPFIIRFGRRNTIVLKNCLETIPKHFLASMFFTLIQSVIYYQWVRYMKSQPYWDFQHLTLNFFKMMVFNLLTYWCIIGVTYLLDYHKKNRENELRASKLETQLAQSQLEVLKMQLHPHFLFNTLHAISALVQKDPEAADNMISQLSDLLRMTLENSDLQEVPLKEELEFLKLYLDIQKTRFRDRLEIKYEIEPETLAASVPNFILQPLVENSIKHGIDPRASGGKITIKSSQNNGSLKIEVCDDGSGLPKDNGSVFDKGLGLANTQERLRQLYGTDQNITVENAPDRGVNVTFEIPFRIN